MEEIPVRRMPQTLTDAVEVTRQLGLRFLWIDALCILQGPRTDSRAYQDWKKESVRMKSVYGNAFVTIVAAGAPGSQYGLRYAWPFLSRPSALKAATFSAREPSAARGRGITKVMDAGALMSHHTKNRPAKINSLASVGTERHSDKSMFPLGDHPSTQTGCLVEYQECKNLGTPSRQRDSLGQQGQMDSAFDSLADQLSSRDRLLIHPTMLVKDKHNISELATQSWSVDLQGGLGVNMGSEAISGRAWTLQEWLLSRRLLVFATTGVYFICDERPLSTTNLLYSLRLKHPGSRAWMLNKIGHINPWQRIVMNFCARDLTDPADKLPAISGLIEAYSQMMGWPRADYVAGLWRETLLKDLLWIRASIEGLPPTRISGRQPNRAPSWSWASIDGNVVYLELPKQWCPLRGTTTLYIATLQAEVRIYDEGLAPESQSSGSATTASTLLLIRCRYLQAFIDTTTVKADKSMDEPFKDWNAITCTLGPASLSKKNQARIVWDDPSECNQLHLGEMELSPLGYKLYFLGLVRLTRDMQSRWVGLVVRFNEAAHKYRRLGVFDCPWPGLFKESNEMDFIVA